MQPMAARRFARATFAFIVACYAASIAVTIVTPAVSTGGSWGGSGTVSDYLFIAVTLAFPVVGLLILSRQPTNTIGWLFLTIGLVWGLIGVMDGYGRYGLTHPGTLPGPLYVEAVDAGMWVPGIGLIGTFLILLFPDGHLPSPRWRKVAILCAVVLVVAFLGVDFSPGTLSISGFPGIQNPLAVGVVGAVGAVFTIGLPLIPICIVLCAIALVRRYRRSRGQERLQMKWLASAAAFCAALYFLAMALTIPYGLTPAPDPSWLNVPQVAAVLSLVLIPVACGAAILKYRLYEIDVVINRALVYGALAAFITAVYVAIVVGVGAAIGQGSRPNLGLSILATAVVALSFGPVKERVQRLANRLVYGKRATPYELLSSFSAKIASSDALEQLVPRMAETLAAGTGAAATEIWLATEQDLRLEGSWPQGEHQGPASLAPGSFPPPDERSLVVPVSHQGEALGYLVVRKRAGESFTPTEEKLLQDVAAQAGLVLRNVRLIADLRASRQRLVAAQDAERRKLERNIHDGAQQRLVALAVRFNLARKLLGPGADGLGESIERLGAQTQAALENLRDLARGIYPPLLADKGLVAALEAQANKAPVPTTVLASGISRYSQDVEAAVYFCCLEALQNVGKYANASSAVITLEGGDRELRFEVRDDGTGFDRSSTPMGSGLTNMGDRLDAIGGSLSVESRVDGGTIVSGRIPLIPAATATTDELGTDARPAADGSTPAPALP